MNIKLKSVILGSVIAVSAVPLAAQSSGTAGAGQNAAVTGGRSIQVLVAQSEIKSDINLSNVAVATGGGLLGGLIGAAVDSARAKKAEALIAPTRDGMAGFDADALAIQAAKASFANAQWLTAGADMPFSKDSSPAGKSAFLDKNSSAQAAFVEYTYDLSPEFNALRLVAKIEVANKAIPATAKGKAEKRVSPRNLVYAQTVTSVMALPDPRGKETDAVRWSADGSALTRQALTLAFDRIVPLTQRSLALSAEEAKALNNKANKKIGAAGYVGRPQPTSDGSTVLWGPGFIRVENLPVAK